MPPSSHPSAAPAGGATPRWRALLRPRWLVGHALVLAVLVAFVNLGGWQLDRLAQRRAANARLEARLATPPEPYADLRARAAGETGREGGDEAGSGSGSGAGSAADSAAGSDPLALRRTEVAGRFDPARELLIRNRSRRGEPGWHVLTPLLLPDGGALLVDRGWVPYRLDEPGRPEFAPPEGRVRLQGVLRAAEPAPQGPLAALAPRDPAEGPLRAVARVDVARLQPQFPYPLEPRWLQLTAPVPPAGALPLPPEPPRAEAGSHLSYAVQWFAFALITALGYALLLARVTRPEADGRGGASG